MEIKFGKYTVSKEDAFNYKLTKTVDKGTAFGKVGVGTTEKRLGYYGNISDALRKLLNNEILEDENIKDIETILTKIKDVEELIVEVCKEK